MTKYLAAALAAAAMLPAGATAGPDDPTEGHPCIGAPDLACEVQYDGGAIGMDSPATVPPEGVGPPAVPGGPASSPDDDLVVDLAPLVRPPRWPGRRRGAYAHLGRLPREWALALALVSRSATGLNLRISPADN